MAGHRRQASLEDVINFSAPQPLAAEQRPQAVQTFFTIVDHFRAAEESSASGVGARPYSHALLVRHTYEYSLSELSKDTCLRVFYSFMGLDIDAPQDPDFSSDGSQLGESLNAFADFLLDNFYIPLKATGQRTPQPSPAHLSAIERILGAHEFLPTPERISYLRRACLIRDHYRCVISRIFDAAEALRRFEEQGENARDVDGDQMKAPFEYLEVAHIIPHSLTQADAKGQLTESKKAALMILNMFDCNISHMIDGVNIDRPFNAISLTPRFHSEFGSFWVFFDPVPEKEHTYRIKTFRPPFYMPDLPVERSLLLAEDQSIEPPSPRLLAIHRAIAHILHLSGAGEYIDKVLRDIEELETRACGSTELGRIVTLRMGGWLSAVHV